MLAIIGRSGLGPHHPVRRLAILTDAPGLGIQTALAQLRRAITSPCDKALGGYYRTGDVAVRGEAGYFTYIGRSDDVFESSGYRISPFKLESVLIEHKAFVILRQGHPPSPELARHIIEFARQQLAPYKRVRRIEFSDLPKTISGKIRRLELQAQARAPGSRGELEFWEEDFSHDSA